MQKSTVTAIQNARKNDEYLFNSLLHCMMIEVEKHVGVGMHFVETGRAHEPGSPVLPRGYLGYPSGWDVIVNGERHIHNPTRILSKLTVRSGFVKAIGGFTFVFPGDERIHEIECWATMNVLGVGSVVLRSLNGERMISNLDPGGLDLPFGSSILDLLKLFDRENGHRFWYDQGYDRELHPELPMPLDYWDLEAMYPTEIEVIEVHDSHDVIEVHESDDVIEVHDSDDDTVHSDAKKADECLCLIVGCWCRVAAAASAAAQPLLSQ